MRITESLQIENVRRGYQELCSDCEACGLKKARINEVGLYMGYFYMFSLHFVNLLPFT